MIVLIVVSSVTLNTPFASAAEKDVIENAGDDSINSASTKKDVTFNANVKGLAEQNSADESFWLDLDGIPFLVLQHLPRGKIFRGNLVLLHAQGEHADHPRFIREMAKHFSQIGWQIYIPNLPKQDYPIIEPPIDTSANTFSEVTPELANATSNSQTDNKTVDANSNSLDGILQPDIPPIGQTFFADTAAYQKLFSQLLKQLLLKIKVSGKPLLAIANQNSAYWVLQPLKSENNITQIVLFHPQIPKGVSNDLKNSFEGQFLPVYTFLNEQQLPLPFINSFEQHQWQTSFLRIYRGHFSNWGNNEENLRFAKMINGWVLSQSEN